MVCLFRAPCFPCNKPTDDTHGDIPCSPRCSTSNPYYSSSSCSSVPARTFAQSRRGSLTVTSKGACAIFLRNSCMCSSSVHTPACSPSLPTTFPTPFVGFSSHPWTPVRIYSDANGLLQLPWRLLHVRPNWCVFSPCRIHLVRPTEQMRFVHTGERLSPYVALACIAMAARIILS